MRGEIKCSWFVMKTNTIGLKPLTLAAILILFAAVFFTTLMIYLLLQFLVHGHYYYYYLNDMDMYVNAQFGRRYNTHCTAPTTVSDRVIKWTDGYWYLGVFVNSGCTFDGYWYLGVFVNSGCTFKCNYDNAKLYFFRAFNALYNIWPISVWGASV